MAKNSFVEEVTFNKGKRKSGASGLVFKFPGGLECFSSKNFLHNFFFER